MYSNSFSYLMKHLVSMSSGDTMKNEWHDPGTNATLHFNEEGMFVDENGKGPQKGFLNDNNFCDWLTSYVQSLIIAERFVTFDAHGATIYHTPNALQQPEKLLVLICGSGRIMAGLWSVGVCAYSGLNAGSMLPMISEAKKRQMEIIILNPNAVGFFGSAGHVTSSFNEFIIPAKPSKVWIVAHSFGGYSTCNVISSNAEWAINHIMAFALSDAVEARIKSDGFLINKWAHDHGINWVKSQEEINKELPPSSSLQHRSANTDDHPMTTWKAFPYIWEWFDSHIDKNEEEYVGEESVPLFNTTCSVQ